MKKHLSTILLVAIYFIGLSVLLYPTVADYVNSKHQSRAIAEYVETLSSTDPDQFKAELEEGRAYNEAIRSNLTRFAPSEEELAAFHQLLGARNTAIGYIEIPAIRVDLPLYLGTEETVLQVGVGCMPGSSLPIGGESTHAVLTGHRGLPSSRLFTDLDQLAGLIPRLRLRGFGGTDFRPAFAYVEQLLQTRQLTKLDGLLYFTDGVGTYPDKAPDYKTAFIFNRDDAISPRVPSWAIRAVLTTDTIRLLPVQTGEEDV